MIEVLDGLHEKVNYRNVVGVKLFHNKEYEDYPEHWHTSIEIIMPVENHFTVIGDSKTYDLRPGDIAIINSGVLHSLKAPKTGERIILQFNDYLLYSLKEMDTLLSMLPPIICLTPENDNKRLYSFIKKRMDAIVVEYDHKKTFFGSVVYAQLIEIFVHLGRSEVQSGMKNLGMDTASNDPIKKKEYMETVMGACNYINKNFKEQISLEEVADISGFSRFHFSRIFKQCMNMTFYEYLNQRRILRAEELLSTTSMSVTEISMNSGFSSISAFNRTFRSITGCSPTDYRSKTDKVKEV